MARGTDTHKGQVEEVCQFVRMQRDGSAWKTHQSGRVQGTAGLPDIFCTVGMRAFWVEVKVGKDRLRDSQREFKCLSGIAGVPVVVGRVGDVADFLEL